MNNYLITYIVNNAMYRMEIKAKDIYDAKKFCSMYINGYVVSIDLKEE